SYACLPRAFRGLRREDGAKLLAQVGALPSDGFGVSPNHPQPYRLRLGLQRAQLFGRKPAGQPLERPGVLQRLKRITYRAARKAIDLFVDLSAGRASFDEVGAQFRIDRDGVVRRLDLLRHERALCRGGSRLAPERLGDGFDPDFERRIAEYGRERLKNL